MSHIKQIECSFEWLRDTPISMGVRVGNMIFVSGQVALDDQGKIVGSDITTQTTKVFENLTTILRAAGATLTDVVKLTSYFTLASDNFDMAEVHAYWKVRDRFFGSHKPSSTGVGVKKLMYPELLVEVEAIAIVTNDKA